MPKFVFLCHNLAKQVKHNSPQFSHLNFDLYYNRNFVWEIQIVQEHMDLEQDG